MGVKESSGESDSHACRRQSSPPLNLMLQFYLLLIRLIRTAVQIETGTAASYPRVGYLSVGRC